MKFRITFFLATSTLLASVSAQAQFARPENAIKYRQSAMSLQGAHTSRLGAMMAGRVPFDAKVAQDNADILAVMAKLPWQGFGAGTEGGKAKPNIWTEAPKFKALNEKHMGDADRLAAAAKTGNLDQIRTAFATFSGNCKTCHDDFQSN